MNYIVCDNFKSRDASTFSLILSQWGLNHLLMAAKTLKNPLLYGLCVKIAFALEGKGCQKMSSVHIFVANASKS